VNQENARTGDFIKDLTPRKRSLGLVMLVDEDIGMMRVKFPKIGKANWILWENNGRYLIIK
jgi:hypothetical protein